MCRGPSAESSRSCSFNFCEIMWALHSLSSGPCSLDVLYPLWLPQFFLTFFCQIPGAPGRDRVKNLMDNSSLDSLCITSVCESWHPLLSAAGRRYLSRSIADYHCEAYPWSVLQLRLDLPQVSGLSSLPKVPELRLPHQVLWLCWCLDFSFYTLMSTFSCKKN